ncbi:hypothetical protein C8R45DRAFT_1087875 [Mycena sanguinolenta]|nr:hypothetical protein C8R45DRAFT_1087875 [Mycena sanguinolenta]
MKILVPWRFTAATRIALEGIITACTGLRALSVTRPGILCEPLSHRVLPSEITIQSFDASLHLTAGHLTHLRISELGDPYHPALSILAFSGSSPHLSTHFALARRMDANENNDEVGMLLASRRNLKMIIARIFPARWPHYSDDSSAESSGIWAAWRR